MNSFKTNKRHGASVIVENKMNVEGLAAYVLFAGSCIVFVSSLWLALF